MMTRGLRRILLGALLPACGRFDFGLLDDAPASTTCTPWISAGPIAELASTGVDWAPAVSADGNRIVFSSDRSGDYELYMSTRSGASWTPPALLPINSALRDTDPAWTPDGSELYFTSNRSGDYHLYVSAFDGTSFAAPVLVPGLESVVAKGPWISADGLELLYTLAATMPDDLARATRGTTSAPWTDRGTLAELNSTDSDGYATLTPDGLTIYFETVRNDPASDIFVSHRSAVGAAFDPPSPLADLDVVFDKTEGDPDVARDGTTLLWASNHDTATIDVYSATRTCN
jgi:Tol biopolymer transport system component